MARKRMIDPGIWASEDFGTLSDLAQIYFIGLFSNADDDGRLKSGTAYLKATIRPYAPDSLEEVEACLVEIATKNMIHIYEAQGTRYIFLPKWKYFQKISHPQASPIPVPPERSLNNPVSFSERSLNDSPQVSLEKISLEEVSLNTQTTTEASNIGEALEEAAQALSHEKPKPPKSKDVSGNNSPKPKIPGMPERVERLVKELNAWHGYPATSPPQNLWPEINDILDVTDHSVVIRWFSDDSSTLKKAREARGSWNFLMWKLRETNHSHVAAMKKLHEATRAQAKKDVERKVVLSGHTDPDIEGMAQKTLRAKERAENHDSRSEEGRAAYIENREGRR